MDGSKLPVLSGREVIKVLSKAGFRVARQRGSHIILVKIVGDVKVGVVVPNHDEIDKGTLLEIIRESRLTRAEFERLL